MGGGGCGGEDERGMQRRVRRQRKGQNSEEAKAEVGAGCEREGQEETEIAMRPT